MFNIVLYEPEIPPNTGNIIRLAANCGCQLHLIEPLGFQLDEKRLRRAGLDYHEFTRLKIYRNYQEFLFEESPNRILAFTTRATKSYAEMAFQDGDYLLFGPETRGLPQSLLETLRRERCLRLPMLPYSRSLNLSNTVAIVCYEALRQHGFAGLG